VRNTKIFKSIIPFILGLVFFSSLPSFVLCITEDGHIRFEIAKTGFTNSGNYPYPNNSTKPLQLSCTCEKHLGGKDCYDIPIVFNFIGNHVIINFDSGLTDRVPLYSKQALKLALIKKRKINNSVNFHLIYSKVHAILQKMSFII